MDLLAIDLIVQTCCGGQISELALGSSLVVWDKILRFINTLIIIIMSSAPMTMVCRRMSA